MNKQNKKTLILISMLLSITFFLFGPVEYYMTNINEIWFGLNSIIAFMLVITLISTAILYLLLRTIPKKLQMVFVCFIFSLGLGLYLQGNYLNVSYGLLNGQKIIWENYAKYGTINTFIWVIIIVVPFLMVKLVGSEKVFKAMKAVSLFILAIQLVTMTTLFLTTNGSAYKNGTAYIGTTSKDLFTFSEDQNVLIYILDTFDAKYMDQLLQEDPDFVNEVLSDFTYYPDTLGAFPTTKGALPQILTGEWYDNTVPYSEYIRKSWDSATVYKNSADKNYDVGIYANSLYVPPQEKNFIVNWSSEDESSNKSEINNKGGLIRLYYKMVAFKYLPHYLKKSFVTYTGDLDVFRRDGAYSASNDFAFYEKLLKDGIELQENKVFKIVHLFGTHPPYTMDSNIQRVEETTVLEQAKGVLKILNHLFKQLKENDVYDKSTIIILADHGDPNSWAQNPLFMVKDYDSSGKLEISDVPISYEDMPAIFNSAINDVSVNDFLSTARSADRTRKFCYYDWFADGSWDKDNLPPITKYIISGKAKDFPDSHIQQKSVYDSKGKLVVPYYKLGDRITFGENKKDENYFDKYSWYGFSYAEGDSTWSYGYESCLDISFEKAPDHDLALQINFSYMLGKEQRLKVYTNNVLIGDDTSTEMSRTYNIPLDILKDNHLKLIFAYPDATTPKGLGIGEDNRILAYKFESVTLK